MTVKFHKKLKFGDCAFKLGFITREQVNYVASKQNIAARQIGKLCIEEGFMNDEQVAKVIAMQYGYEYVDLNDAEAYELMKKIPMDMMIKHHFIPYKKKENEIIIAMSRPGELMKIIDELELLLDTFISVVIASEDNVQAILKKLDSDRSALDSISDEFKLPVIKESETGEDIFTIETINKEESLTVRLVNSTILDAINKRASDIHIELSDSGVIIRYRIDGMLYQATETLEAKLQSAIISRIKVMSELDISEKRIPQDGRFKIRVKERNIDFRVSIIPTIFGEDAVIRILDQEKLMKGTDDFRLDGMELPEYELLRLKRMIRAPYGMFLMTGPTGSGKTTTLYRALSEVNNKDVKIVTIEDPVEYQLQGIVQIQVNEKKGLTFARGLRSILRHDPDKILVGEIRDTETAQIAIQSALTGHLVFTTVHANRSFEVINRFTHMGIASYDLMSALNCIVAQRLMRTLCECREITQIPEKKLKESGLNPEHYHKPIFYKDRGCEKCKGTGFKGRKAIIELVELDDDMREMFVNRASAAAMKKKAEDSGTIFLRKAALTEVFKGHTTLEEANRITFVEKNELL